MQNVTKVGKDFSDKVKFEQKSRGIEGPVMQPREKDILCIETEGS